MTAKTTLPVLFGTGVHGSRPSASDVGAGGLYACSTHSLIYQSDGVSTWSTWASLSGTGLTDPMTTRGDIITRDASNTTARLGIGSSGKVLSSDGTDISWQTPSGGGAPASKVPVQEVTNLGSSANSQAGTWGSTPTNGNLLIACIESEGGTNVTSISQTNVTWTKVAESTASTSPHAEIWKGVVGASASTSMTVNFSGTTFCGFTASEWNGITGTLDQSATVTNQSQTSAHNAIPTITPTNNNALVILACAESTFGTAFVLNCRQLQQFRTGTGANITGEGLVGAFGFPGTNPIYGFVSNSHGGTFSAAIVSVT